MKPKLGNTRKLARERGNSCMWGPNGLARKKIHRTVKRGLKAKAENFAFEEAEEEENVLSETD